MTALPHRLRRTSAKQSGMKASMALFVVIGIIAGIAAVVAIVAGTILSSWLSDLPDYKKPGAFDVSRPTTIYSADGKLLARLYLENREVIPLNEMSPNIRNAIIAVEDERFYKHNGVDPQGIIRAAVTGYGGASTLTQQYIRQTVLLDEATQMSIKRKVREAFLALELEKMYSKDEILAMYLNTVYFGEGAYGIEAAAQTYFAKSAKNLSVAEAAMLAGLPQQPSRLSPYDNPKDALERRNQVLRRMLSNEYITQAQYDDALGSAIKPKRTKEPKDGIYDAPYFVAAVKKELQQKFSTGTVFGGGLTVTTTLDTRLQKIAEKAVHDKVGAEGPEGALVSIEPKSGNVIAMVGGRDYKKSKFNLATQAYRQPGSSFKTFTLAAAIKDGMSPSMMVNSSSPAKIDSTPPWFVSNSEGKGRGMISLASATAASVNTVFARVAHEIGAKKVVAMANRLGIKTKLKAYDSISLGAQGVTVFEMASAYATIANDGMYNAPTMITKVVDRNGKNILARKKKAKRVIDSSVAYATTKVLQGVVSGGTGTRARLGSQPVAGKTGTSQENRDVWFAGYTPQLSTVIWVGWKQEKTIFVNGMRAYGGTVCAPIWHDFMSAALADVPVRGFKKAPAPDYDNSKYHIPVDKAPNTVGWTLKTALTTLEGYDITVVEAYSTKKAGIVVSQKVSGMKITLTVSKGPKPAPTPEAPVDPGTGPGTDPGTGPGTDPGTGSGTNPGGTG